MVSLLTPKELAKRLNVPVSWVYDRTRRGGPDKLPHLKIGKYIRFDEVEVLEHLKERQPESRASTGLEAN